MKLIDFGLDTSRYYAIAIFVDTKVNIIHKR